MSRKRRVIDGKHIITATELNGMQEAEKATETRKGKQRNKVSQKRGSMAQKELIDESEVELELSEDEAREILGCIDRNVIQSKLKVRDHLHLTYRLSYEPCQ